MSEREPIQDVNTSMPTEISQDPQESKNPSGVVRVLRRIKKVLGWRLTESQIDEYYKDQFWPDKWN